MCVKAMGPRTSQGFAIDAYETHEYQRERHHHRAHTPARECYPRVTFRRRPHHERDQTSSSSPSLRGGRGCLTSARMYAALRMIAGMITVFPPRKQRRVLGTRRSRRRRRPDPPPDSAGARGAPKLVHHVLKDRIGLRSGRAASCFPAPTWASAILVLLA